MWILLNADWSSESAQKTPPGAMVARVRGSATILVHYYAHITLKFSGDILEGYESLRLITIFFPT